VLGLGGLLGLTGTVLGQKTDTGDWDTRFMRQAARDGLAEIKLAKLARDQAANADVRKFAKDMVTDHAEISKQLSDLADTQDVTLPKKMDRKRQGFYDRLSKLKGAEFDREYLQHLIKDHVVTVGDFREEASDGTNVEVAAFATKTLPTLRNHLKRARELAGQLP
jgi:putative membrane protein